MSRGHGRMQEYILRTISQHGCPITFVGIRTIAMSDEPEGALMHSSVERSLRRALQRLVETGYLAATRDGGPRTPHQYCISPVFQAFMDTARNDKPLHESETARWRV